MGEFSFCIRQLEEVDHVPTDTCALMSNGRITCLSAKVMRVHVIIIIIIYYYNYCTDLNYEYDVQSYLFIYIN